MMMSETQFEAIKKMLAKLSQVDGFYKKNLRVLTLRLSRVKRILKSFLLQIKVI